MSSRGRKKPFSWHGILHLVVAPQLSITEELQTGQGVQMIMICKYIMLRCNVLCFPRRTSEPHQKISDMLSWPLCFSICNRMAVHKVSSFLQEQSTCCSCTEAHRAALSPLWSTLIDEDLCLAAYILNLICYFYVPRISKPGFGFISQPHTHNKRHISHHSL